VLGPSPFSALPVRVPSTRAGWRGACGVRPGMTADPSAPPVPALAELRAALEREAACTSYRDAALLVGYRSPSGFMKFLDGAVPQKRIHAQMLAWYAGRSRGGDATARAVALDRLMSFVPESERAGLGAEVERLVLEALRRAGVDERRQRAEPGTWTRGECRQRVPRRELRRHREEHLARAASTDASAGTAPLRS
jgi:hypothetical protein